MNQTYWDQLSTKLGVLSYTVDQAGRVKRLTFGDAKGLGRRDAERCRHVRRQLVEYFAGRRTVFELELNPVGSAFQQRVWQALTRIPYGDVCGYGELAKRVGNPRAARAVGQANGANPIPIIIPCHRVVAGDGSIGGYSGGLAVKRYLLALERAELAA